MHPTSRDLNPIRLTALDGLRGLAALFVAADHVDATLSHGDPTVWHAYLAVDFFFVLSGFVLAMNYDARFAQGMSGWDFMKRRFMRLAPLFWIGCAVGLFSLYTGAEADWPYRTMSLLLNLAFIPSPFDFSTAIFPADGPGWSLFFEILVANALFGFLWHRLHGRTLWALNLLALAALAWVIKTRGHVNLGFNHENFGFGFARVMFSFFAGVQLFRHRDRLPRLRVPALLLAGMLVATMVFTFTSARTEKVYEFTCITVIFPAIVHFAAGSMELSKRAGYILGEMSYSLYVLHVPLITFPLTVTLADRAWPGGAGWQHWYQVPVVLVLALIAWLVARWIDLPIQRALARVRVNRRSVTLAA